MGLFERMLLAINPRAALERAQYRELYRSYYAAADGGRKKGGWTAVNATGEVTNRAERDIIRARARQLEANDDMLKAVVLDLERNVVGTGITLQARVRDRDGNDREELNNAIERAWRRWSKPEHCTVTRTQSLWEVCKMVVRRQYVDGGILILKTYTDGEFRLQLLEVDDLDTSVLQHGGNRVVGGVEIDGYNRPVAYHLRRQDVSGLWSGRVRRVDADRVIYLPHITRCSQIREMSPAASSLPRIDDINLLVEAALKKEQTQACYGMAVIRNTPGTLGGIGRGMTGTEGDRQGGYPEEYIAPGMIKYLQPGEDIKPIAPSGVSSTADAMIRTVQRQAGAGAGLSYEAVSRDMSQVNYSSARQGMLQDRKTYGALQQYLIDHFLEPVYREWLGWAVLTGRVDIPDYPDDPEGYQEAVWIPPGWEWIDPLKEANANSVALQSGQTTLQKICAARGEDWRELLEQRAREIDWLKKLTEEDADEKDHSAGT